MSIVKKRILIVDDTPENIQILLEILKDQYDVLAAINGKRALKLVAMDPSIDLILLDILMPEMDGYEVIRELKANPDTARIPVIFITGLNAAENEAKGLDLGAVDYIIKPFNATLIRSRVRNHIELKSYRDKLEEKTKELVITRDVTIETLGSLAEYRNVETGYHIKRTMNYVQLLAEKLQDHPNFRDYLDEDTIEHLWKSAPLHDIGKVGVPDRILMKTGRFTPEEYAEMQRHVVYGWNALTGAAEKLGPNSFLNIAQEMAYTHHEKWDGTGYPRGLKGTEIPIPGRLMAVADVYDALITQRVYKPAYSHQQAVEVIANDSGKAFDPEIVKVFLKNEDSFNQIAAYFDDNKFTDHEFNLAQLSMPILVSIRKSIR